MNTGRLLLEGDISSRIKDKKTLQYTLSCMNKFPAYFWTAPSSQDYHPCDERSSGGLVLHTRRLVRAIDHMAVHYELTAAEKDILISAAILHDSFHKGLSKGSTADVNHPSIAVSMFTFEKNTLDEDIHKQIMSCVISHMGKHSVHPAMNISGKLENIFKLVDYIVSRENVIVNI